MKLNFDFTKYVGNTLLKDWWPAVLDHIRQIQNAVNTNDTAITTEVSNRESAVSGEASARTSADTALGKRIDAEAEARAAADDTKADKATHDGGFTGGRGAGTSDGGAIGINASTAGGAAVGKYAKSTEGGAALGANTSAANGGAVGTGAQATDGFSGGNNAKSAVDAIQLGTGTNTKEKTLQVYDYTLMDADGKIPAGRIPDLKTGLQFQLDSNLPEQLQDNIIYCTNYDQGIYSFYYDGGWQSYSGPNREIENMLVGEAFTVWIENGHNIEGYLYIDDERKYVLRNIQRLEGGKTYIVCKLKEIEGSKPDLVSGEVIAEEIPDAKLEDLARFFINSTRGILEIGDTLRLDGELLNQKYLIDELSENKAERTDIPSELPPTDNSVTMAKLAADVKNAIAMSGGGTTAADQISMEITVPRSGWVNETDPDGYDYRIDISVPSITPEQEPELTFHKSSLLTASKAGICAEAETTDGALRLWSRRQPDADMTARVRLMVPAQ